MNRNPSISVYEWPETPLIISQCEVMGKDLPSDQYLYWIEEMWQAANGSQNAAINIAVRGIIDQIEIEISEFVPWQMDPATIAFDLIQAGHARWSIQADEMAASIKEYLDSEAP